MSTCLTTVLDGVVNNKNLRKPGEIRIKITKQDNYIQSRSWFQLTSRVNQTITLINDKQGDNYFFNSQGTNFGTSVDFSAGVSRTIYCTNGDYEISIPNKYALSSLTTLRVSPQKNFFTVDIDELKYIPTISTIELSGTTSKGDIKSLVTSTALTDITFERTNVKGDLEDLSPLTRLMYMRFAYSQNVTGDISVIENMPNLRNVEVLGCIGITGNLSSFASCPELRWVCTPCIIGMPSVEGDISAFANATKLNHLEIRNEPNVTGNINVIASNTTDLNYVSFYGCNVSGDIADLAPCDRLSSVTFAGNKNVTGDLGVFLANKDKMSYVEMTSTGISGDISDINIPLIITFIVNNTGVSGTIGKVDFAGLTPDDPILPSLPAHEATDGFCKHTPSLVTLNISNTQISGDIDVLANCGSITNIQAYNSNISGNIASLAGLSSLTGFNIGYTNVYGDIGTGLSGCTNLTSIYVEYCPYIYGDLSKLGNNMKFISASASSGVFSWQTTRSSSAYIISMQNVNMGDDLDAMLINQANCQVNNAASSTISNAITVRGNRSADPTVRSNANNAILTLMNKGYSVTINGTLQTESLVGNDAVSPND